MTGGVSIVNRNDIPRALDRIVQDNASYYLLGFERAHTGRAGRFVSVDVRVRQPGLEVRARDGYLTPFPEQRALLQQPRPDASVADGVASVVPVGTVSMQAFVTAYRGERSRAVIPLVIEIDASTLDLTDAEGGYEGEIEVRHLATDVRSRVQGDTRHTATVFVPAGPGGELPHGTMVRMLSAMELDPGTYQVRVAAGTAGRAGSVLADLDVPNFTRGGLALSGVTIGSMTAVDTVTVHAADPFAGALPAPPTAARQFDRTDELVLFFEVYDNRSPVPADALQARTELRRADGTVVATTSPARPSAAAAQPFSGHAFTLHVPLAQAPPGRYVLHVEAQSDARRQPEVVSHAVPIEVR